MTRPDEDLVFDPDDFEPADFGPDEFEDETDDGEMLALQAEIMGWIR